MYLKWDLPSVSHSAATLDILTASGRPPQGTNKSALNLKCAPFLKSVPSRTTSPAVIDHISRSPDKSPGGHAHGNLTSCSSTLTRYPSLLNLDLSKLATGTLSLARRTSSPRLIPAGSARTPLPSMTAIVLSELSKISSMFVREGTIARETCIRTRAEISICQTLIRTTLWSKQGSLTRTTSLDLGHVFLPETELLVDTQHVLSDRQRGHSIRVVRHTTKVLSALASGERLPPRFCAAITSMH